MTSIPNLNPTPKQRFLASDRHVHSHNELINREDLQSSLDAALAQYQIELCIGPLDANAAAASHFKLMGALEFINTFKYLALQVQAQHPKVVGQLDHKV